MNIEYTKEQLDEISAVHQQIHEQTIISRNASEQVLKLHGELELLHTRATTAHYKRVLATSKIQEAA